MIKAIVLGGGGFIGHHLIEKLKSENYYVLGVDLKHNEFQTSSADEFILGDLRDPLVVKAVLDEGFDEVYQLAADMGGAGFVFSGDFDADIMSNSALININVLNSLRNSSSKVFYASSACIYPEHNQMNPEDPDCREDSAFPANPDSEYGWEKLFSERLYTSFMRNHGVDIRIARFHNIYGPYGVYDGGREKAPAALCRKVIKAKNNESIEIWGDGNQTRSFLYIDSCIEGIMRLMKSSVSEPINIGSTEMISINHLAQLIIKQSNKTLAIKHIDGPLGVRGRCSSNTLIQEKLNWQPVYPLDKGIAKLYNWIDEEISNKK